MILPFVRDILSELEKGPAFRAAMAELHAGSTPSLAGLTPPAKSLYLPHFARLLNAPILLIVADNKAADAWLAMLRASCDLSVTGFESNVLALPAYDVLPFENLSPHPELQENRAVTLFRIATCTARIVICPVESATYKLRDADFYRNLAQRVRVAQAIDIEGLISQLNLIGYQPSDLVEMPGQWARRGSIL